MPIRIEQDVPEIAGTINHNTVFYTVMGLILLILIIDDRKYFINLFKSITMRIFITLFFACFVSFLSAQSFTVANSSKVAADTVQIEIAGASFKGGYSRTGSIFIYRTSAKSGEVYKSYLGHKSTVNVTVDGQTLPVWSNVPFDKWDIDPDAKFYTYVLGKTGYPSKLELKKD